MCGIAGVVTSDPSIDSHEAVARMIDRLSHRGPDERGVYCAPPAIFGHSRLSIIDIAGGRQPMLTEDNSLCITFNGEIFNYVELREELIRKGHAFATRSDTEVILHLYQELGERCVEKLNGQWAFAIWDAGERKLFLSRDRLGVRPLFYTQADGSFVFASEIKSLLAFPGVGRALDIEALNQIFTFWVTLPPRTAFRNIQQLPAGHSLTVGNGGLRVRRYWQPEYAPDRADSDGHEKKLAEELLSLLVDATRIRLRSDVPVGAYLSGGLDSTVIAAITKQLVGERLRTFSVAFDDAEFDESAYQQEASAFLRTDHSVVRCSLQDIAAVFPDVVRHAEQPILRTAPAPLFLLSELVRNSGYKVVLTGEGADEILGGYDILKETKIRRFWASNPSSSWRPLLLKRLYPYMESIQRQPPAYLKRFFHATREDLANPFFSHLPRWDLTAKLKMFLSDDARAAIRSSDPLADLAAQLPSDYASWTAFRRAEYLETAHLLPGYILSSQGDRMAMAHAVEGRYPFLDHRVVEFSAKLPTNLKMKVLNQKYLLKLAANGMIPPSIQRRPKQPYRAPDGRSFFAAPTPYIDELLSPEAIRRDGVFNPQAVAGLVAKFRNGRAVGVRDDMALVGILSTQLLLSSLVNGRQAN